VRQLTPPSTPSAATPASPAATREPASTPKADALLEALDADGDGSISKAEFTNGALELLGRGSRGDRSRNHEGESESVDGHHHHHRSRRLERRLSRLFDRVDGNGDGAIEASEMKDAFTRIEERKAKHGKCGGCEPQSVESPAASVAYASVTVVAVAVRQYAAVSAAA
jgi:hypothetical protein